MLHSTVAALIVGCAGVHPVATAAEVDHRSTQQAVQLAAVPSPFEVYPRVFGEASRNADNLRAQFLKAPFPILRVTRSNQDAAVRDAVVALAAGDLAAAVVAAIDAIVQPFKTIAAALSYLGESIRDSPDRFVYGLVAAASPLINGVAATGKALWDIVEAAFELDVVGVVNAVLNVPATILDGVLNGEYARLGPLVLPGLLSMGNEVNMGPGLPSFLIALGQDIAKSIPIRSSTINALATVDSDVSSTQAPTTDERAIPSLPTAEEIDQVSTEPADADSTSVTDSDPSELGQESSGVLEGEEDASEPETPVGVDDAEITTDPLELDQESSGVLDGEEDPSDSEMTEGVDEPEINTESNSGDESETAGDTAPVDRGTGEAKSSSVTDRGARSGERESVGAP
ncbi:hypothetical protein MHIP_04860 [Mycolicibacterium hippocampi]|uniref:PE-PGRS family protein n=1 Tax=Mycolicibacterium hippocampi TaxID=659824 RepID=A0A7I9ZGP5_9MYCO|nr:hypothetical protein MHIP_04860 [Mycolicibacterium hippocampi]